MARLSVSCKLPPAKRVAAANAVSVMEGGSFCGSPLADALPDRLDFPDLELVCDRFEDPLDFGFVMFVVGGKSLPSPMEIGMEAP